ncbi:MAG: electron transport complex subunit RsxA [Firmicutes bacterium]|nr:electron transport complex subunit RsxA [Bacillota bacterium]HAL63881.1 electron transport complex subunit RsxA [Clostridiales bacterium]
MNQPSLISLLIAALFTENFVLVKFLGCCPFLGVSKKTDTALGMGMAVVFIMSLASAFTWCANYFILEKFNLEYLQTIVFILIIAGLVQFVEMVIKKSMPALYNALGIYLPLITTNCAVLAVTLINVQNSYDFIHSVLYGAFAALGFSLAIILFAGIRETINEKDVPESFRGFPIALVTAGLMAMAFLGFSGFSI